MSAATTRVVPVSQLAAQPAGGAPLVVLALCAQWCGTCREFHSTLERLAEARRDIVFAWADVEDDAELVGDLDVENFPTLALFRAGLALHYGVSLPHETLAAAAPRAAAGLPAEIEELARRLSQPDGG
ncbi:MAG: thioredoxin family protein [Thauera sp.]